jgi:hypothetical protein
MGSPAAVNYVEEPKTFGQVGYEAYSTFTGNKTYDGKEMPIWAHLTSRVQEAWRTAAASILMANNVEIEKHLNQKGA